MQELRVPLNAAHGLKTVRWLNAESFDSALSHLTVSIIV